MDGAKNFDYDNFIIKHWVSCHSNLPEAPCVRFKVLKSFQDVLSRLATEAVLIERVANMNSKSEFRSNKISRIVVVDPRKKKKSCDPWSQQERAEAELKMKIEELRRERGVPEKDVTMQSGGRRISKAKEATKKKGSQRLIKTSPEKRVAESDVDMMSMVGASDRGRKKARLSMIASPSGAKDRKIKNNNEVG